MNQSHFESDARSSDEDPSLDAPQADRSMTEDAEANTEDPENVGEHPEDEVEEAGLSLDDLGAAYARVAAEHDPEAFAAPEPDRTEEATDHDAEADQHDGLPTENIDQAATPEAIIEGALFVGHPQNKSLSEQRIASLMRDVTPEEVEESITQLNESYKAADQALRIVRDERGYRMTIAPEVEDVRRSFLGKVREAKLSQPAIDVLALVAYQPGITSQTVQDQRGQDSGSILNQLVRRQLIQLERKQPTSGGKKVPHYYITERFLQLFGLETIEDLPQVEESFRD
ncbi:MAG: SMC-Scp complex subunit ScpB [Rubripirellula sp.]|nr:SMC-Scp complex subunit ScpB [Rubripirellula sp.]